MLRPFLFSVVLLTGSMMGLASCTPIGAAVGAGATVGVAAYQERGVQQAALDVKTESEVATKWLKKDSAMFTDISVEVYEGRALLTGIAPNEDIRADAVRLAWQVNSVIDVINEIMIAPEHGVVDIAKDSWISTQLKSKITFDGDIMAVNYSIETVDGIVYLIGIGQNKQEVDRVKAHARTIDGVKNIISHVRIKKAAQ